MKICSKCKIEKELSEFHKKGNSHRNDCKECRKAVGEKHRAENRERINAQKMEHYYKNQEKCLNIRRDYVAKNKETINKNSKQYYIENADNRKQYAKIYRESHKDSNKEYQTNYRVNNRESIRKTQYQWEKNELENNPAYKIRKNLRGRVRNACGRMCVAKKTSGVHNLLKNDEMLMKHFENQWTPGMNWDNYGEGEGYWNVDHHIPFAYFSDTQMLEKENQEIINHPINLRPMWAIDNLKKLDKLPEDYLEVLEQIKEDIDKKRESEDSP